MSAGEVLARARRWSVSVYRLVWPELDILVGGLIVVVGLWVFVELAGEVSVGATRSFDERLLLSLRTPGDHHDPLGPRWVEEMIRDFSALGGVAVLTLLTVWVLGYLVLLHKRRAALLVFVSVVGGWTLSTLLKAGFERPRPDLVPHGSIVHTASFPSGHSMMSTVFYLTLGALLARLQPKRRLKVYVLSLAALITLLVGMSRVYLGVHWPTDVLAGWTVGAVWALCCWLVALLLQRRGKVEQAGTTPDAPPEEQRP